MVTPFPNLKSPLPVFTTTTSARHLIGAGVSFTSSSSDGALTKRNSSFHTSTRAQKFHLLPNVPLNLVEAFTVSNRPDSVGTEAGTWALELDLLHTLRLSGYTDLIFMTAVKEGKQISGAYEIPRLVQKGYRQLDVE